MIFYEGTSPVEVSNFPDGEVQVHTDSDITIAFWFPKKNGWGDEIAITAPGDFLGCGGNLGRLTGSANVRILR